MVVREDGLWAALTHLESLAQLCVRNLFYLQILPTTNINKIEIVVGSPVNTNSESTKRLPKVHARIFHLLGQTALVYAGKTI